MAVITPSLRRKSLDLQEIPVKITNSQAEQNANLFLIFMRFYVNVEMKRTLCLVTVFSLDTISKQWITYENYYSRES